MTQYDTFKAQIEVTYSRPAVADPLSQSIADADMFLSEPVELLKVLREAYDEDTIDVVVTHEATDPVSASEAELEAIRKKFGVEETDDEEDWG